MNTNVKEDEEKNKESINALLNIIKKNNIDSNLQVKLEHIEKRINE
mgnify:FL=1